MGTSRVDAQKTRKAVVSTAARLLREHGLRGVGVADVMNEAGLTHGGFYKHFETKEALLAEATVEAFADSRQFLTDDGREQPTFAGIVSRYLSYVHRDEPGIGCPGAAYACDISRADPKTQSAFTGGIETMLASFEMLAPRRVGETHAKRRARLVSWAAMSVGAVCLARAVKETNPTLSDEFLDAVRGTITVEPNR